MSTEEDLRLPISSRRVYLWENPLETRNTHAAARTENASSPLIVPADILRSAIVGPVLQSAPRHVTRYPCSWPLQHVQAMWMSHIILASNSQTHLSKIAGHLWPALCIRRD